MKSSLNVSLAHHALKNGVDPATVKKAFKISNAQIKSLQRIIENEEIIPKNKR